MSLPIIPDPASATRSTSAATRRRGEPMLKVLPVIALVSLGVVPLRVGGQASPVAVNARPSDDSVTVQASQKYGASGVHRFLLGDNYRDHWARPIRVPVLHLDKFAGGLTALEEGGNAQTR